MRLHRFFVGKDTAELSHKFWLKDDRLVHQWTRVLRYKPDDEVVLFDGVSLESLYKITEITRDSVHLEHIADYERKVPSRRIYLLFSILKKDKNDWVIQKATELGITNLLPILADRSEKTGFNIDRAKKIIIEASEQCGRSDIPDIREPIALNSAITELKKDVRLLYCGSSHNSVLLKDVDLAGVGEKDSRIGVFIGPEGGWSDSETELFTTEQVNPVSLGGFTLRSETACVVASSSLVYLI